ncbi:MAG: glycosyltransferase, partial [Terriglobia bacterium]
FGIGLRGDTLLLWASKSGPVQDRYPARLYDFSKNGNEVGSRPLRLLVVHESVPSPSHSGAEKRLWQVLRILRQLGHSVTLVGLREAARWSARAEVEALGIEVRATDSETLRFEWNGYHTGYALDQVLGDGQFDVALMTLWFWKMISVPELYMDEIRRLSPRTRIAILTDDCHWLRQLRSAEVSGRWSDRERSSSLLQREDEVYSRADCVISISKEDMRNLEQQFPGIPLGFLPMSSDPGQPGPGFDARDGLVYMADYQNLASLDAIKWFISHIWPRILSRLPNVKLHLIGNGMPEGLGHGAQNVVRVGYVQDLGQEFAKYRVFVSPVRWGTGIKTKNLNALSHGLPLVTTTVGGEGMSLRHGESALIADTVEEFASAVIKAYKDKAVWKQLSEGGCAHVTAAFSEQNMRARLAESLQQVLRQKPRPYEPGHVWLFRLIERYFPSLLSKLEAGQEHRARIVAYSRLAERLLATGEKVEARRQLSHIFSIMSYPAAADLLYEHYGSVVDRMDRIYRGLGEPEAAAAMRAEASARSESPASGPPRSLESRPAKIRSASTPVFSVVIPTCNRRATLSDCLSALDRQQLSADQFEVIVVDDGSTDGTEEFCAGVKTPFPLQYLRQENAGTGAARRRGIEQAQGEYLLLMNDDTIASPDLLSRHRAVHRQERRSKVAVLGNFEYPPAARARALTYYLSVRPFLFPMMHMKAGRYSDPMFFVTCNLSVPRKAVLEAGSFDADLRVGEDTDLGIRLVQRGFQIIYEPKAQAIHQHLDFKADDLVRRARAYAPAQFKLIGKHPWMLGDGTSPYGRMDAAAASNLQSLVEKGRENVPNALQSIRQFDGIDFERFWAIPSGNRSMAEEIVDLFSVAVPEVYFFYFYQAFLEVWQADGSFPAAGVEEELLAPAVVG